MARAKATNTPYTLIVRGGQQATKLSQPLINALKDIGANVLEFNLKTGALTPRVLP